MFNRGLAQLVAAVAVAQGVVMATPATACEEPLNGIARIVLVDDSGLQIAALSNVVVLQGAPTQVQPFASLPSTTSLDPYVDYSRAGTMNWVPSNELINLLGGS